MQKLNEIIRKYLKGEDISNITCSYEIEYAIKGILTGQIDKEATINSPLGQAIASLAGHVGGSKEDMFQTLINEIKSLYRLFFNNSEINNNDVNFLTNLDTSNVTRMDYIFSGCTNLTAIPLFDTSNVTNMERAFQDCTNLTTIPLFNTSNVTSMHYSFSGCRKLTTIPALDVSKVIYFDNVFMGCFALKSILMYGMKQSFDISASTAFEREDLVTILNNLGVPETNKTLTIGSTNLAKLTEEDKAIAAAKNWTLN